jgi:hypothetical protein
MTRGRFHLLRGTGAPHPRLLCTPNSPIDGEPTATHQRAPLRIGGDERHLLLIPLCLPPYQIKIQTTGQEPDIPREDEHNPPSPERPEPVSDGGKVVVRLEIDDGTVT